MSNTNSEYLKIFNNSKADKNSENKISRKKFLESLKKYNFFEPLFLNKNLEIF